MPCKKVANYFKKKTIFPPFNSTVFFSLYFADFTHGLRLLEVRIPNYVIKGATAQLECLYDLDGEALYSVKWYKDGNEFYRYLPRDSPPGQTFRLPGVAVDVSTMSDPEPFLGAAIAFVFAYTLREKKKKEN